MIVRESGESSNTCEWTSSYTLPIISSVTIGILTVESGILHVLQVVGDIPSRPSLVIVVSSTVNEFLRGKRHGDISGFL